MGQITEPTLALTLMGHRYPDRNLSTLSEFDPRALQFMTVEKRVQEFTVMLCHLLCIRPSQGTGMIADTLAITITIALWDVQPNGFKILSTR